MHYYNIYTHYNTNSNRDNNSNNFIKIQPAARGGQNCH